MSYITGSSSKCGAVKETTYGTAPSGAVTPLRMTAESLRATYNRLDEGVLLASKTAPQQEVGSVTVDGTVNTVLNPSFVDWLLEVSLGKVASSTTENGQYEITGDPDHLMVYDETVYNLADVNTPYLPSSTVRVNRGTQGFAYTGMTVSTLTLDATSQDFVKADIAFNGLKEETAVNTYSDAAVPGSYKCTKAKLWKSEAGSDEIDDFIDENQWTGCPVDKTYDVESTTLTIDNGTQTVPATYCSGLYSNRPLFGQRSVTVACNVPYSEDFETFKNEYYSSEDPDMLALMLMFGSKENVTFINTSTLDVTVPKYQVYVIVPNVSITDSTANASGDSLIEASFTGTAASANGKEPLIVITRRYYEISNQQ